MRVDDTGFLPTKNDLPNEATIDMDDMGEDIHDDQMWMFHNSKVMAAVESKLVMMGVANWNGEGHSDMNYTCTRVAYAVEDAMGADVENAQHINMDDLHQRAGYLV